MKGWILLLLAGLVFSIGRGPHAVPGGNAPKEAVASLAASDTYRQMRCERESNPALGAPTALRGVISERPAPRRIDERHEGTAAVASTVASPLFRRSHVVRSYRIEPLSGALPADLVRLLRRFVI